MKGLLDENDALQQEARRLKARLDALQADSAAAAHRAAAQIAEAVARADAAEAAARAQAAVSAAAEAPTAALAAKCDKLGKRLEEVSFAPLLAISVCFKCSFLCLLLFLPS